MSRATADMVDMLHGLLAGALKDELERACTAKDEEGNPVPINPQLLDKVLKFLKDNGVNAPASSERIDSLASQLTELNLDDEAISMRH